MAAIERLAGYFLLTWGWKRALLAFAAGALGALAMPPFDFFPILFVSLPVLVWLMDSSASDPGRGLFSRLWSGFSTCWWFGFGYLVAGLWWIANALLIEASEFAWLIPLAVIGLPAALAVFYGIGGALARLIWSDGWPRLLALAAGLGLAEYLRGTLLTGFPWNALGYGAMTMPATMQSASLIGLYGVTLLAVPVFAAPVLLLDVRNELPGSKAFATLCVVLVIAHTGFGYWRLQQPGNPNVADVSLRLVQPAIDQAEKWSPESADRSFRTLLDLSTTATSPEKQGLSGTDLLIWPETAFPFILTERRDALAALDAMIPPGTTLLAGAVRFEPPASGQTSRRAFNSIYMINDSGEIVQAADKVHLVPFGEYLPFQEWLEGLGFQQITRLRGGFEAAANRRLLDTGKAGSLLPLICYEIIFPGEPLQGVSRPDWILNVTNDAWFGNSPGPHQHWRQAVIRGVEEGLPVVRVANNGISSVTDARGRTVERIGHGVRGVVDSALPASDPPTLYSRIGNWTFGGLAILFGLAPFLFKRRS